MPDDIPAPSAREWPLVAARVRGSRSMRGPAAATRAARRESAAVWLSLHNTCMGGLRLDLPDRRSYGSSWRWLYG